MKKLTFLVLFTIFSISINSQNYKFNEFMDLGVTIETAIRRHCTGTTQGALIKTNLPNIILPKENIYRFDLGLGNGIRYYKVINSANSPSSNATNINTLPNFGQPILDICNSLSWKYHRPILIGSTELEAKNNFCSKKTVNNIREKVNIKIEKPLLEGEVYLMNFGLGNKYYKIIASDYAKGDSDYDLDTTNNNAIFSKVFFNCPTPPDLKAVKASVSSSSINAGSNKTLSYEVKNIGDLTATSTRLEFHISSTTTNSREFLVSKSIGSVNTNQTITGSITAKIPLGTKTDTYKIFMKVSTNGDSNSGNNTVYSSSSFKVNGVQEYPDLVFDTGVITATSDCFNCSFAIKELIKNNERHIANENGIALDFLQIKIDNKGTVSSTPTKIKYYLSSDSKLDPKKDYEFKVSTDVPSINKNSFKSVAKSLTGLDFRDARVSGDNNTEPPYGNYFFIMKIDPKDESNQDNNVVKFLIKYRENSSKISLTRNAQNSLKPSKLDIYDFTGNILKSTKVNSTEQENTIINSLPSGLYIIKTPTGTRKITK
ncbi:T9SS type A sorting domain-containing protein [Flavivirga eckloniae]|uniref:CARDB domain-containing protein n=1 Tax=Flavivirga eckloniae TaxID=1803846 RepID=A0A2K9PPQ5_9FLAO|nr:T9SS type A sorting domain-containing protein [Flavivirga eckloniae]AUP79025.1 hypothetical protein C1H87_10080 [Flavivirga eckloniae]